MARSGGARDLDARRARRWWRNRPPIRTIQRAAGFIDDLGFALLFPTKGVALPSLYEAATDLPPGEIEWGPDAERVWGWKDELPRLGLAWYGKFLRSGRASFLSPQLLADLYPRSGDPADFAEDALSPVATRIAEMLLVNGPTSSSLLREALGMDGRQDRARFQTAVGELGRRLVVTNFGVEDQATAWPSAVLELTARAFTVKDAGEEGRARAAAKFLRTTVEATPQELARAFGWPLDTARGAFGERERARGSRPSAS